MVTKTYQYAPSGERLSQTTHNGQGTTVDGFYSYNAHSDVEAVTGTDGSAKATYGYTAYGQTDPAGTTGADKPNPQNPPAEPFNPFRFNAMRFDPSGGFYDMGFRDYSPGLNRFLTRDMYAGALADLSLATDPLTGNRYAFGGGNPISSVEIDGHIPADCEGDCLKDWFAAQRLARQEQASSNRTSAHNAARDAAARQIMSQVAAAHGNPTDVTIECPVAGASKKGTGLEGNADICYRDGNTEYVWEVKTVGESASGAGELQFYADAMRQDDRYKGLNVLPGFDLARPVGAYVPATNEDVVAISDPFDKGVIIYDKVPWKGPPPVTVPEPQVNRAPRATCARGSAYDSARMNLPGCGQGNGTPDPSPVFAGLTVGLGALALRAGAGGVCAAIFSETGPGAAVAFGVCAAAVP
jgi:RHS repeat-associated protein